MSEPERGSDAGSASDSDDRKSDPLPLDYRNPREMHPAPAAQVHRPKQLSDDELFNVCAAAPIVGAVCTGLVFVLPMGMGLAGILFALPLGFIAFGCALAAPFSTLGVIVMMRRAHNTWHFLVLALNFAWLTIICVVLMSIIR